jgi:hypothetical protein
MKKAMLTKWTRLLAASTLLVNLSAGCGGAEQGESAQESLDTIDEAVLNNGSPTYDYNTACTVALPNGTLPTNMHCCPSGTAMVGAHLGGNVFKCTPFSPQGARFLDTSTARTFHILVNDAGVNMHACPVGSVMVGFHQGLNRLACQRNATSITAEGRDDGTQDTGGAGVIPPPPLMHVCLNRYAMSGIHVGLNAFGCATDLRIP